MESALFADVPDDSFLELFDRYVRRAADVCDIPEITNKKEIVNKIDLSTLSARHRTKFKHWLNKRLYMQLSIENLLRRGLWVKVRLAVQETPGGASYTVHIEGL